LGEVGVQVEDPVGGAAETMIGRNHDRLKSGVRGEQAPEAGVQPLVDPEEEVTKGSRRDRVVPRGLRVRKVPKVMGDGVRLPKEQPEKVVGGATSQQGQSEPLLLFDAGQQGLRRTFLPPGPLAQFRDRGKGERMANNLDRQVVEITRTASFGRNPRRDRRIKP
jgi:hypothetical protein